MYNGNNWFKELAAPPWHLVLTMLASAVVQNLKKTKLTETVCQLCQDKLECNQASDVMCNDIVHWDVDASKSPTLL